MNNFKMLHIKYVTVTLLLKNVTHLMLLINQRFTNFVTLLHIYICNYYYYIYKYRGRCVMRNTRIWKKTKHIEKGCNSVTRETFLSGGEYVK